MVGWTRPSSKAGRFLANSRAPAAPMAWPIKLLVLLKCVLGQSANTVRSAWHSWMSPRGVAVACGLTMSALKRAGIAPQDIDIVSTHATATPLGDIQECQALRTVFADCPKEHFNNTQSINAHAIA